MSVGVSKAQLLDGLKQRGRKAEGVERCQGGAGFGRKGRVKTPHCSIPNPNGTNSRTLIPKNLHHRNMTPFRPSLFFSFGPLLAMVLAGHGLRAQSVTFHQDVAPIIYQHCTECHRVGEIGPMPLTTFEEVMPYGEFIEYVTSTGYMPPWTPDEEYAHFVGERVLSAEELEVLSPLGVGRQTRGQSRRQPRSSLLSIGKPNWGCPIRFGPCLNLTSMAAT